MVNGAASCVMGLVLGTASGGMFETAKEEFYQVDKGVEIDYPV
jgi:hypothetical protein